MNTDQYDKKTSALIDRAMQQLRDMDERIFRTLFSLKKIAQDTGDDALMGFTCFHLANAYYSFEISYKKFRDYLSKSILYLQRSGDSDMLARAYNFVGIDACHNGSYDVAYYYYSMAIRACEGSEDTYYAGVVHANIAQIFEYLGDLKKALRLYRKSARQTAHKTEDVFFYHNMINGFYSESILNILLGNINGARRAAKQVEKYLRLAGENGVPSVDIPVSFLRAELAYLDGDKQLFEQRLGESLALIPDAHQLFDYIDDIKKFCDFLLERDETIAVRRLLDIVTRTVETTGVTQMMKILTEIEIQYYEKTGNRRGVIRCLEEQRRLAARQQTEQNRIYLYSIELINAMDSLRREQKRMRIENEHLQIQAQTDALTGIPNRFAMNKFVESAFERAYAAGYTVGIEILDVDYFKEYNDTYGHQKGDVCLKKIASELKKIARKEKVQCARYGGDEFVLIFEDMEDEEVMKCARRLEERVRAIAVPHKKAPSKLVTVSQGICNAVPNKKSKLWDFLTEADKALYEVKRHRKQSDAGDAICLRHIPHFSA